jgi:hypothetical protein
MVKITVFYDMPLGNLVLEYERFRGICCAKCRHISTKLHGGTSQKRIMLMLTAAKSLIPRQH